MPQSGFIDSDGRSEPADHDPLQADAEELRRRCRASGPMRTAALRAGLAACLAVLAVAVPDAAWRLGADLANPGTRPSARAPVPGCAPSFRLSSTITPSWPADTLFRRRDVHYRTVELRLLQRRYAQLRRCRHHSKWRQCGRSLLYPSLQQQHWTAALYIDGTAESVGLSGPMADDVSAGLAGWTSSIVPDPAMSFGTMQDGVSSGGSGGPFAKVAAGTLTLSGGSIPDTNKVTVNAGGTLQLLSTSDWSFNAKFAGEFAPDASKATVDAGGTLQLFSTPNWSFGAKFDGGFAPDRNKTTVDAGGALQLLSTPDWSFIAKFAGEFARQPQLYAASGTLHHAW